MTHRSAAACVFAKCVAATVLALPLLTGCGSATRKSFEVELTNQSQHPVTVWLTKDGPPAEPGWHAPETLAAAAGTGGAEPAYDFAVVPPGKTGFTGKVAGEFPDGTNAVVRVYSGATDYFKIADAARAGADVRADHVLRPGRNRLLVREQGTGLVIEPAR